LGEDEAKRDVRARVPESRGEKRTDEQNDGRDSRQVRFKVPDKQGEKRVVEDAARDKRPEKASKVDKPDGNEKGRGDRPHSVEYIRNYCSSGDAKIKKIRAQDVESTDLMKLKSRDEMGHVFVGGLDTNDQEDAGAWGDGEYVDERTGLNSIRSWRDGPGSRRLSI